MRWLATTCQDSCVRKKLINGRLMSVAVYREYRSRIGLCLGEALSGAGVRDGAMLRVPAEGPPVRAIFGVERW